MKGDIYLLADKVDAGIFDSMVELAQVFQQPDAGGAVDGRYEEQHLGHLPFPENQKFIGDLPVVEEFIGIAEFGGFHPDARGFLQVVIGVEFVLVEHLIYRAATVAAKLQGVADHRGLSAIGTAVSALIPVAVNMVRFFLQIVLFSEGKRKV